MSTCVQLLEALDETPSEEIWEQEYRRGYCDGFLQAIGAFYESRLSKEKTYYVLWAFALGELFTWSRYGDMKNHSEFPPTPVLKVER